MVQRKLKIIARLYASAYFFLHSDADLDSESILFEQSSFSAICTFRKRDFSIWHLKPTVQTWIWRQLSGCLQFLPGCGVKHYSVNYIAWTFHVEKKHVWFKRIKSICKRGCFKRIFKLEDPSEKSCTESCHQQFKSTIQVYSSEKKERGWDGVFTGFCVLDTHHMSWSDSSLAQLTVRV